MMASQKEAGEKERKSKLYKFKYLGDKNILLVEKHLSKFLEFLDALFFQKYMKNRTQAFIYPVAQTA